MTGVILDDLDGTVDRSTTLAVGLDVVCCADLAVDEVLTEATGSETRY